MKDVEDFEHDFKTVMFVGAAVKSSDIPYPAIK